MDTNIWHLLGANFGPCVHIETLAQTYTPACVQAHKADDVCVREHYFLFLLISPTGRRKNLIWASI